MLTSHNTLLLALSILLLLNIHPAPTTAAYTLPPTILPNGAPNPFFPCPANHPASCPYRCYNLPSTNLTSTSPVLLDTCYTAKQATALIDDLSHICVKCVAPLAKEVPASSSDTDTCTPLSTYFNATDPSDPPPARCGAYRHLLPECKWDCGAAQVPFSLCDTKNTTGMYRFCERCTPQCSSPRVVFEPLVSLPKGFMLGNGSCGVGEAERVACPFRCKDAGNPYYYCSLVNRTVEYGFTTCEGCV